MAEGRLDLHENGDIAKDETLLVYNLHQMFPDWTGISLRKIVKAQMDAQEIPIQRDMILNRCIDKLINFEVTTNHLDGTHRGKDSVVDLTELTPLSELRKRRRPWEVNSPIEIVTIVDDPVFPKQADNINLIGNRLDTSGDHSSSSANVSLLDNSIDLSSSIDTSLELDPTPKKQRLDTQLEVDGKEPTEPWVLFPPVIETGMPKGLQAVPKKGHKAPAAAAAAVYLPTEKDQFDEMVKTVITLFPLAEPQFVRNTMKDDRYKSIELMVNYLLELKNYPMLKQKKKMVMEKENEKINYFDLARIETEKHSTAYKEACMKLLQGNFRKISVRDIRLLAQYQNHCYAIMYDTLSQIYPVCIGSPRLKDAKSKRKNDKPIPLEVKLGGGKTCKMTITVLKCGRPKIVIPSNCGGPKLAAEIRAMSEYGRAADEEKDRQLADELIEKDAEENGQLIECGCCFGECPFEHMIQCYEGHLFCRDCLNNYAKEAVYGQGKSNLTCMTTDCETSFPVEQLKRVLPAKMLERYDERVKEEALNLADMPDLVRCPHCNTAAVLPPEDKVFTCPNQDCLMETCRHCKEEWSEHFGIPCNELEKKDETNLRLTYEEKMTKAIMRMCHKCKTSYMKTEGCNRMTCRCNATMCYICRAPTISYKHFCAHPREPGKACTKCKSCSLWTSSEEDDARAVEELKKEAAKERQAKGFEREANIGAPEEAQKLAKQQEKNPGGQQQQGAPQRQIRREQPAPAQHRHHDHHHHHHHDHHDRHDRHDRHHNHAPPPYRHVNQIPLPPAPPLLPPAPPLPQLPPPPPPPQHRHGHRPNNVGWQGQYNQALPGNHGHMRQGHHGNGEWNNGQNQLNQWNHMANEFNNQMQQHQVDWRNWGGQLGANNAYRN